MARLLLILYFAPCKLHEGVGGSTRLKNLLSIFQQMGLNTQFVSYILKDDFRVENEKISNFLNITRIHVPKFFKALAILLILISGFRHTRRSDIIFIHLPRRISVFPHIVFSKIFNKPLVVDNMDIKDPDTPRFIYNGTLRGLKSFSENLVGKIKIKMNYVVEAVKELIAKFPKEHIKCLETGTIRTYIEKQESTRHIGETLGKRGLLLSIDNNENSIKIAQNVCSHLDNIEWKLSNSTDFLRSYEGIFHFVFLDSVNDAEHIHQEFKYAIHLIHDYGIIIIDDSGISLDGKILDPTHPLAKKGQKIFKHLRRQNIPFKILQTIQGTQLRLDVTPEIKRILKKQV